MKNTHILLLIITISVGFCGCKSGNNDANTVIKPVNIDLPAIQSKGKLTALTGYSATTYFIYRGEPMGYEYELLKMLEDYLDLEIEIKLEKSFANYFNMLNSGEADLIAYNLTVTKPRMNIIDFTAHHSYTRQVLVQKKPDNWRQMKLHEIDETLIQNQIDLVGKKVHVINGSVYANRLQSLSDEIGGDIDIITAHDSLNVDELIKMVSQGAIEYTVADEHIAQINAAYYSNIDIDTPVSFPQRIAWAVRKTSPQLKAAVDEWITAMKDCTEYYVIYNKYFENRRAHRKRIASDYSSISGGSLSKYDESIMKHAVELGWDWRLLASLIYQESQFDPNEKSWAGAIGLMQVMPKTGRAYVSGDLRKPENNLKAGTEFLKWLQQYWQEIPDSVEQIKFILASYNAGQGHIRDAAKLAKKYGKNPAVWTDNTEEFILKKSDAKYYNDEAVSYGYCRGEEPYYYVREILERYEEYRLLIE